MTDKSKAPATEELNADDLDKVQGGYTEVEWTVKDAGKDKREGFTATDDLANIKSGWKVEEGESLKDAKDSGNGL